MAAGEQEAFEANVTALMMHLPSAKFRDIEKKGELYNEDSLELQYTYWCNQKQGTPEHPITFDGLPPNDDRSNVKSPIPVNVRRTDYEKLFQIILHAYESIGLTWRIQSRTAVIGKISKSKHTEGTINDAEDAVVDVLLEARAKVIERAKVNLKGVEMRKSIDGANQLSFADLVEELRERTPPTPIFVEA